MTLPILSRKLTLETPIRVADGAGGYSIDWQPMGTLWAEVKARTGAEGSGVAVPLSKSRFTMTVRAAPIGSPSRPRPEQRFRDDTRLFAIDAVVERDVDARFLTCYVTEEVAV